MDIFTNSIIWTLLIRYCSSTVRQVRWPINFIFLNIRVVGGWLIWIKHIFNCSVLMSHLYSLDFLKPFYWSFVNLTSWTPVPLISSSPHLLISFLQPCTIPKKPIKKKSTKHRPSISSWKLHCVTIYPTVYPSLYLDIFTWKCLLQWMICLIPVFSFYDHYWICTRTPGYLLIVLCHGFPVALDQQDLLFHMF